MKGIFGSLARSTKSIDWSEDALARLFGLQASKTGLPVTLETALRVSVVLACARVIAEGVAQIPFKLYRSRPEGGADPATDQSLYKMLWRQPNDWMTSFEFRETLTFHAVLAGNGFAYKNKVRGKLRELIPIIPAHVTVCQAPDYTLTYKLKGSSGNLIGTVGQEDMFHLRGPSWNGWSGLDMIKQAREAIGLAQATEETHARFHANGARMSGILSPKQPLGGGDIEEIKKSFAEANAGIANVGKTAVMPVGFDYSSVAMKGVDAQHIETRRLQIEEVCRAMRVFPMMVMQSDKTATFASAEQFFLAHVIHTLGPWIERWEHTTDRDLVADLKDDSLYSKLSVQGLMRGDAAARGTFYQTLYNIGGMNPNEIRDLEEMNPYPGGEKYRVPLNMAEPNSPAAVGGAQK